MDRMKVMTDMWTERHLKEKAVEYGRRTDAEASALWTDKRAIAERAFLAGAMYVIRNTRI